MAMETAHEGFVQELLRFHHSLSREHRELLSALLHAATRTESRHAGILSGRAAAYLAEEVLLDLGQLKVDMDGDYVTCGGSCKKYTHNDQKEIWCLGGCTGDVSDACGCHLYSYDTPKKGDPPPKREKWKHIWKPGDPKIQPEDGKTYECVCVRPKPKDED